MEIPKRGEFEAMRRFLPSFPRQPLISVLMPTHNSSAKWLDQAIRSVRDQIYPHWELCIADDASSREDTLKLLEDWRKIDPRIKVRHLRQRGHISRASNAALEDCTGEFAVLLDHDDELPPHALFHVAWEMVSHPEVNVIFSDEDKIDEEGRRSGPYFKTGWNYDLLLGQNCVSHLGAFRVSLMREIGGFRPGYEGSQDWDLTLRATARCAPESIRHIPRILYHWRLLPSSAASGPEVKPYAIRAGRRAVEDHLRTAGTGAMVGGWRDDGWRIHWPLSDPEPMVSPILAGGGDSEKHARTMRSLLSTAGTEQVELILILGPDDREPDQLVVGGCHDRARVVRLAKPSHRASHLHAGAKAARGEVLIFLDYGIEAVSEGWLRELASQALRPDVGAVGACLLQPNDTIQHAGFVVQMSGLVGHVFRYSPSEACSVGGPPNLARELTAVSASAMGIRREVYFQAGGFDAPMFPRSYHDVDLCLRLRDRKLRIVYTPFARFRYIDLVEPHPAPIEEIILETARLVERWPQELAGDRFFNPNLSLRSEIPVPASPRLRWPWQDSAGS